MKPHSKKQVRILTALVVFLVVVFALHFIPIDSYTSLKYGSSCANGSTYKYRIINGGEEKYNSNRHVSSEDINLWCGADMGGGFGLPNTYRLYLW